MCNWEDDGQSDEDADIVRGGPNGDYSLSEARLNFNKYMCMYELDRDMRITGGDTPEELELKKMLKASYEEIGDYNNLRHYKIQYKQVLRIEEELHNLTKLKLDAIDKKTNNEADAK